MLSIQATQQDSRAVLFTGELTDDLSLLLDSMDLTFHDDLAGTPQAGTRCFIDGDEEAETAAIFPGYYFVVHGPFWDVMTAEDFELEFKEI